MTDAPWGWTGQLQTCFQSSASYQTKNRGAGRRGGLTSCRVAVTDPSTKQTLTGEVPEGHYSKREMQVARAKLRDELISQLWSQVEHKVAHLYRSGLRSKAALKLMTLQLLAETMGEKL